MDIEPALVTAYCYTVLMHSLKKSFHIILALVLIFIGIAGMILPILDGFTFFLLGLILLSFESPYVEAHLHKIAHKNSVIGAWYEKLNTWMRKVFGEQRW